MRIDYEFNDCFRWTNETFRHAIGWGTVLDGDLNMIYGGPGPEKTEGNTWRDNALMPGEWFLSSSYLQEWRRLKIIVDPAEYTMVYSALTDCIRRARSHFKTYDATYVTDYPRDGWVRGVRATCRRQARIMAAAVVQRMNPSATSINIEEIVVRQQPTSLDRP